MMDLWFITEHAPATLILSVCQPQLSPLTFPGVAQKIQLDEVSILPEVKVQPYGVLGASAESMTSFTSVVLSIKVLNFLETRAPTNGWKGEHLFLECDTVTPPFR